MVKKDERIKIEIEREKEMRDKGISKMISEGGLGADKYYEIKKVSSSEDAEKQDAEK